MRPRGPIRRQRPRKGERGQMLVETAIIMPIMIFAVLGALQLMMLQHARVMTEYAAYNAARAGIVNNLDRNVMRNAAMWSALPLYRRTDNPLDLLITWGTVKIASEITEAIDTTGGTVEEAINSLVGFNLASDFFPDTSIIDVEIASPTPAEFQKAQEWMQQAEADARTRDPLGTLDFPDREVDFDLRDMLLEHPEVGRLSLEAKVLVPLRIPIINWIFFQLWYAQTQLGLSRLEGNITDWANQRARIASGQNRGAYLDEAVSSTDGAGIFDDALMTSQRTKEARMLRDIARKWNWYFIPIRSTYSMQMQSNPFKTTVREPVWFSLE